MKNSILSTMLQQSFPFAISRQCLSAIKPILDHSMVLKSVKVLWIRIELIFHQSSFINYFQQRRCFLDPFFQDSFFIAGFTRFFFTLTGFFASTIQKAFSDSFFQRKGQSISQDISKYSIRPFAFVFFAYLSIAATMRMAFGKGLNRSEVLFIFVVLLFLWLLSFTRIPLRYFSKKSIFLAFLKDLIS